MPNPNPPGIPFADRPERLPFLLKPRNQQSARPRISWDSVSLLMRTLWDGPCTMKELTDETGLAASTVRGYVKSLRKRKLVAVVDLLPARNGNRCVHVYQWKPDSKDFKVKKKTAAERQAALRARKAEAARNAALCFLPEPMKEAA